MSAKTIQTAFRLTEEEIGLYDDVAQRLGITRVEAVRLGLHALKREMGLDQDDVVLLHERLAGPHGDDAVLKFTVSSVESQQVEVLVGNEPREDLQAHVLYAMAARQGQPFELPPEGTVVMKDLSTDAWYTIGPIMLKRGASKEVSVKALPDLRQGGDQTAEERRTSVRMNAMLRRLSREGRGEAEDE